MKKLILITAMALVSTGAWGLSIEEVEQECNSREGDKSALEKYVNSIKGQSLEFLATVKRVTGTNARSANIYLPTKFSLSVSAYTSGDVAADLQIDSEYLISATIYGLGFSQNSDTPTRCFNITVTDAEFSNPDQ